MGRMDRLSQELVGRFQARHRGGLGIPVLYDASRALAARLAHAHSSAVHGASCGSHRDCATGKKPKSSRSRLAVVHERQLLWTQVGVDLRGTRDSPKGGVLPALRLSGRAERHFHVRKQREFSLRQLPTSGSSRRAIVGLAPERGHAPYPAKAKNRDVPRSHIIRARQVHDSMDEPDPYSVREVESTLDEIVLHE